MLTGWCVQRRQQRRCILRCPRLCGVSVLRRVGYERIRTSPLPLFCLFSAADGNKPGDVFAFIKDIDNLTKKDTYYAWKRYSLPALINSPCPAHLAAVLWAWV